MLNEYNFVIFLISKFGKTYEICKTHILFLKLNGTVGL